MTPKHPKHHELIQQFNQNPEAYTVWARKPNSKWLEIINPIWSDKLEYRLEPKPSAGHIWYLETTENELTVSHQVVTRCNYASYLELVQSIYPSPDFEVRPHLGRADQFEIAGTCHIQVYGHRSLNSTQLQVLTDLNLFP